MSIHQVAASKLPKFSTTVASAVLSPQSKRDVSISELSIGQLKMALEAANVSWSDCIEKGDLVRKLRNMQQQPKVVRNIVTKNCQTHTVKLASKAPIATLPEVEKQVPIKVNCNSKAVEISVPVSWTVLTVKQFLFKQKHTKLIPAAQKIIVRGKILDNDQAVEPMASNTFMLLRDHNFEPSEVSINFILPSNRPSINTYSSPKTTINQLKQLLQKCHNFPEPQCYSICKNGVELSDEQSIKSFCSDDGALSEDGRVTIDLQVVPTMLLKLSFRTEISANQPVDSAAVPTAQQPSHGSLVPSKMSTGLVDASISAAATTHQL